MILQAKHPYGYAPMTTSLMDKIGWNALCKLADQNNRNKYSGDGEKE